MINRRVGAFTRTVDAINPQVAAINSRVDAINPQVAATDPRVDAINPQVAAINLGNSRDVRLKFCQGVPQALEVQRF